MSETPVYILLAELNTLMTGALRLSLAFMLLTVFAWALSWGSARWLALARYFTAWCAVSLALALMASLIEKKLLTYQNPFVNQGVYLSAALLPVVVSLLWFQTRSFWAQHRGLRVFAILCSLFTLTYIFLLPSFSRSDKVFFSTIMTLPFAIALAYFPLVFLKERPEWASLLHLCWGLSASCALVIYYGWLWPFLSGIPHAGEFYPYINLHDWLLVLFVILYLGNVYIDYWLKQRSKPLLVSWNYLALLTAVLCLWLNTNIFDTLAL